MRYMGLPKDLLSGTYKRPRLFLCGVNKEKICELEATSLSGSFKFNSYDELTFTVGRTYTNMITGETDVNPFYDQIESLRTVLLEGFGYFEIQEPEIVSDGIREVKNVTAYGYEYTLAQKYLEEFDINTGEIWSIDGVTLYDPDDVEHSLLHMVLEKTYGCWTIGHVDDSLRTMSRQFEISRVSIYDFIVQDICEKFNCFAVFDTVDNTISLYAEALITKFIGDGVTTSFIISPPYTSPLGGVSINSYKTTAYTYDDKTGILTFKNPPESGSVIEVTDGSQDQWTTDVYVTFENLAQEISINYSADDIKTVLSIKGADDLDIREVNMGLPYLVDISYYYSVDWMGKDLFDAYTKYLKKCNDNQIQYTKNATDMLDINDKIQYEENRTSLQYSIAEHVNHDTVGTYYIKATDEVTGYDKYEEVTLPGDYNSKVVYYTLDGTDINEKKFQSLYKALQTYFKSQDVKDTAEINDLKKDFLFLKTYTLDYLIEQLSSATSLTQKDRAINNVFDEIWQQLGKNPLNDLYYKPYSEIKKNAEEDGWNDPANGQYWEYYPMLLIVNSLESTMNERDAVVNEYKKEYTKLSNENSEIQNSVLISDESNFTRSQLITLNAFLREDEYTDDNFFLTGYDTNEDIIKTKQELMECGRIELQKLCEPKLSFSMDMSNIYAMPEFSPIVDHFQLGNLIRVELRKDYVKRARILEVSVNFDDFSDFTCEFGELTNLRTPSSIHADLLSTALTAGKSVASNASYWQKGVDKINNIELKIQQGLLDAVQALKDSEGNQYIDTSEYGLRLMKRDANGNINPKQGWMINNSFLYSDDGFKTARAAFGEYTYNNNNYYGVLAEALVGKMIVGGSLEISNNDGTLKFDKNGFSVNNGTTTVTLDPNSDRMFNVSGNGDSIYFDENGKLHIDGNGQDIDLTLNEQYSELKNTTDGLTSKVGQVEMDIKGLSTNFQYFGTCSTGEDRLTKEVTLEDFQDRVGAIIAVLFTEGNTNPNPGLVINGGYETLVQYNDFSSEDGPKAFEYYIWPPNSVVVFVRSDDYWVVADSGTLYKTRELSSQIIQTEKSITQTIVDYKEEVASTYSTQSQTNNAISSVVAKTLHYGTCETDANDVNKIVNCDGFELYNGASIAVKFSNSNTVVLPFLDVNNTGRKPILADGYGLDANDNKNWPAGAIVNFVYDGSNWNIADSGSLSKIVQTADSITAEVSRATEAEKSLSAKIQINADAITSKVSAGELSSAIQQTESRVRYSWNQSSKYIQLEDDGSLNIYKLDGNGNRSTLLMKQNDNGTYYYHNGNFVGKIGAGYVNGYENSRGIIFDISDGNRSFMAWVDSDKTGYNQNEFKLVYSPGNVDGLTGGFTFNSNVTFNDSIETNNNIWAKQGIIIGNDTANMIQPIYEGGFELYELYSGGIRTRVWQGSGENYSTFGVYRDKYTFSASTSKVIDVGGNSIVNQSDARLKTNINDTKVNALDTLSNIELKEFDWIEDGSHEAIGMIAQQLQTVAPDLVFEDSQTGKLSIKTIKLIPYLIKAIQELSVKND